MKWEYKYIHIDSRLSDKKTSSIVNEELNKLGNEGWGLVNFTTIFVDARYAFIFKRPKELITKMCIKEISFTNFAFL